ncbi:MAG: hypothetical protein ACI8XO_002570 [Verrucomicrobiales bacterium]|jgi:hypothetical protein
MIKVFLILSSVVLIASAVLGWMNREEFITVRTAKDDTNEQTAAKMKKTDGEIETLNAMNVALDDTHQAYDESVLATQGYDDRITSQNQLLTAANTEKAGLMEVKSEYDQALEDLRLKFAGIKFDEIPAKIQEMKDELAEAEKKKAELELSVAAMGKRVERNNGTIQTYSKKQAERSQGISLNGTEGTITAVNQDWGFAVINIGKNQGVSADSELIVKRGTEIVGKLSIVSIEPRLTVADIRQDTLRDGARILPGDKVIFEKLQN